MEKCELCLKLPYCDVTPEVEEEVEEEGCELFVPRFQICDEPGQTYQG